MTTKQIKLCLLAGAVLTTALALGVLAWAVFVPLSMPDGQRLMATRASNSGAAAPPVAGPPAPSRQALRAIADTPLRQPLKPPVVVAQAKPELAAVLRGTAYEPRRPGQSLAVFRLADGTEQWFSIGESFNDPIGRVTVKQIEDQKVTIEYGGAEHELKKTDP